MKSILTLGCLLALTPIQAIAQTPENLMILPGRAFPVYYSSGHQSRAETMAIRIEQAMAYHQRLLDFRPDFTLLVLGADDWSAHTPYQVVYGMQHYVAEQRKLVLAAEDNPFWRSFLPPLDQLPPDLRQQVRAAYADADGAITAQPFFDLLAIHELGHAFHFQAELDMQRNWMGELFCNIFLHTYVAEMEKEQLPALTVFPRMVVGAGVAGYTYTTLPEIHEHYMALVEQMPRNYGWYQCRFHVTAADIYDTEGPMACRNLWDALRSPGDCSTDEKFAASLLDRQSPGVAAMITGWEANMIR